MWFKKRIKYYPKVGDRIALWWNLSNGIDATKYQEKPHSAILMYEAKIADISKYSFIVKDINNRSGSISIEKDSSERKNRDDFFLEKI